MARKDIQSDYYYNFNNYQVHITFKHIRNIIYHYDKEKHLFKISAPYLTSLKTIYKHLDRFAPKLITRADKHRSPMINDSVYIFANLVPIELGKKNQFINHKIILKKKENLNKVLKLVLKKYLDERLPYYEKLMDVKHHKFSVKNMHTRFGSNSYYSNRLSFALSLVHFSYPIIDSVIVHELAHDIHHNHEKRFYDCVLEYCPNYHALKKALDMTQYEYGKDQ